MVFSSRQFNLVKNGRAAFRRLGSTQRVYEMAEGERDTLIVSSQGNAMLNRSVVLKKGIHLRTLSHDRDKMIDRSEFRGRRKFVLRSKADEIVDVTRRGEIFSDGGTGLKGFFPDRVTGALVGRRAGKHCDT